MKIIVSGPPGSGKSTVAKKLAAKYNLKYYSIGILQREMAQKKGITLTELSELEEKDDSIDKEMDERQKEIGKEEDFVMDSRLGSLFIPDAEFRIFVDCKFTQRAQRIYAHNRADEGGNYDTVEKNLSLREESEEKRFKEYYNFDYKDMNFYNIWIDNTKLNEDETIKIVLDQIESYLKKN